MLGFKFNINNFNLLFKEHRSDIFMNISDINHKLSECKLLFLPIKVFTYFTTILYF